MMTLDQYKCNHEPDPATAEWSRYGRKVRCKKCGLKYEIVMRVRVTRDNPRVRMSKKERLRLRKENGYYDKPTNGGIHE